MGLKSRSELSTKQSSLAPLSICGLDHAECGSGGEDFKKWIKAHYVTLSIFPGIDGHRHIHPCQRVD